jgi:Spy/CpxP family protein refolding chaperone
MKKWYVCTGVCILALSSMVALAFEDSPPPADRFMDHAAPPQMNCKETREPGRMNGGFMPSIHRELVRNLNLSKEQLNKIRELENVYYKETRDMRYDLALKHIEMCKLFTDSKTDENALYTKQKEISALNKKLIDKTWQKFIEERKILTPEQLAKLDQMPRRLLGNIYPLEMG